MKRSIRVLQIVSGDLWAGAEAQAFALMTHLAKLPDTAVRAAVLNDGKLASELQNAGLDVDILDERRIGSVGILLRLRRILKEYEPDVIHTHRLKENVLGSLANRMWRNVAAVRTVHGSDEHAGAKGFHGMRRQAMNRVDRWCGRVLQRKIIAVSNELGWELSRTFSPSQVVVIENGIDVDRVLAARGVASFKANEQTSIHIGLVGRLVPVKRVDIFIEMASLLKKGCDGRKFRFHVFGDGPLRGLLEEHARAIGVSDAITFHGHRDDIATCIGGLDALVNCSDHEGMPMTALEALALNVPIVAHSVGGLRSVVPEQNQVVQHDPSGYRDVILKVVANSAALTHEALAKLERFSAGRNANRIRALYENVIHDRALTRTELR